jgi:hypothetical protein
MSIYTVARTVVYYFEVQAESEQEALIETSNLFNEAAFQQHQVTQDIVNVEETA